MSVLLLDQVLTVRSRFLVAAATTTTDRVYVSKARNTAIYLMALRQPAICSETLQPLDLTVFIPGCLVVPLALGEPPSDDALLRQCLEGLEALTPKQLDVHTRGRRAGGPMLNANVALHIQELVAYRLLGERTGRTHIQPKDESALQKRKRPVPWGRRPALKKAGRRSAILKSMEINPFFATSRTALRYAGSNGREELKHDDRIEWLANEFRGQERVGRGRKAGQAARTARDAATLVLWADRAGIPRDAVLEKLRMNTSLTGTPYEKVGGQKKHLKSMTQRAYDLLVDGDTSVLGQSRGFGLVRYAPMMFWFDHAADVLGPGEAPADKLRAWEMSRSWAVRLGLWGDVLSFEVKQDQGATVPTDSCGPQVGCPECS